MACVGAPTAGRFCVVLTSMTLVAGSGERSMACVASGAKAAVAVPSAGAAGGCGIAVVCCAWMAAVTAEGASAATGVSACAEASAGADVSGSAATGGSGGRAVVAAGAGTSVGLRYCHAVMGRCAVSSRSSRIASDASVGRASTALAVRWAMNAAIDGSMPGQGSATEGTSSCTCLNTSVTGLSDWNGTKPASISQAVMPTEYRSPCGVAWLCSIISGAR